MSQNKFNFTKKLLEDMPTPAKGKRIYYYDLKVRGLCIAVTSTGTKTFVAYKKISGKPERITLGKFPDLSIENARGLCSEVNSKIAQGTNPNAEKKRLDKTLTIAELFTQYMERYARIHKKSWQGDENLYRCYLTGWRDKKISNITRSDVEVLHAKIGRDHGLYVANRLLSLLSVIYNKAIDWGFGGANPCVGIKKFKEKSRERFLHGDELPRFFEALNAESNETLRDFFYISLLTGARKSNVLSMAWKEINLERGTWHIQYTKNGESQVIPLSDEAIEVLARRSKMARKGDDWVFASESSASGHIEEPKSAWKRILARSEIKDLRIHDLRRTLGSWQAATGASSFVIGKSLGHKTHQATAIYARLNLDPVRESVSRATSAMFSAALKK